MAIVLKLAVDLRVMPSNATPEPPMAHQFKKILDSFQTLALRLYDMSSLLQRRGRALDKSSVKRRFHAISETEQC